jgi:hypothetical protein
MLTIEKVKEASLVYESQYGHSIKEYYLYCVQLFKSQLSGEFNVVFGDIDYTPNNGLPTKRVAFQYEHTLVKKGGRDSEGFPAGVVPSPAGENYLVRLCNYDSLSRSDIIVDYSLPNIRNVTSTNFYPHYNDKVVYVSPCLYEIDFGNNRQLPVFTNFYDPNQPRRRKLLETLGPQAQNYTHTYAQDLARMYNRSQIVVNIHQTDHHDTLEELRVLPALRCGAIVISERSALQELIPYKDHIVWADYNDIPRVVSEVLADYDNLHRQIFDNKLSRLLRDMENKNKDVLQWLH